MRRLFVLLLPILGCTLTPLTDCSPGASATPICGFKNPEDILVISDGRLLVSQMGSLDGTTPGSLVRFDPSNEQLELLYPGEEATPDIKPSDGWGESSCPGPVGAAFSPHGINLSQRADGKQQLLVVNHGARESIEYFELTGKKQKLSWRGCVLLPEPFFLNSVIGLETGGFLATHMTARGGKLAMSLTLLRMTLGADTGHVVLWHPGGPLAMIPGSEGSFPNGIERGASGKYFYVAYTGDNRIKRFAFNSHEEIQSTRVQSPDNIRLSPDGTLLIASQLESVLRCGRIEEGACPSEFAVVRLDPETMEAAIIYRQWGEPMGAATVAVYAHDHLWIGSLVGDRLLRVRAVNQVGEEKAAQE